MLLHIGHARREGGASIKCPPLSYQPAARLFYQQPASSPSSLQPGVTSQPGVFLCTVRLFLPEPAGRPPGMSIRIVKSRACT